MRITKSFYSVQYYIRGYVQYFAFSIGCGVRICSDFRRISAVLIRKRNRFLTHDMVTHDIAAADFGGSVKFACNRGKY